MIGIDRNDCGETTQVEERFHVWAKLVGEISELVFS
jgi:hypothetical protein